ncbi:MAG TPA: hypothetical protein VGD42_20580 [Lysobacter sp.]
MAGRIRLTAPLRAEYQALFDRCQIEPARAQSVDKAVNGLLSHRERYRGVARPLGIPWQVVAVIHNMECSQRFDQHLHNGDPLTARTRNVPANRPPTGSPPFTWEASARDALTFDGVAAWNDWSVPGTLYLLERYNGWGYRLHHPEVKSPYLWSFSNHYSRGKYVHDGTWSDTAKSGQVGAATLLRRMAERGEFDAPSDAVDADLMAAMGRRAAVLRYAPTRVTPGGAELQRFLNTFPGIFLREDGKLGKLTSEACKRIFGAYLIGDPRA